MKKMISAFLAVAVTAGSLAAAMPAAKADGGRIAAGVASGLIGGALLGGAIAAQRPAYGYGYEPAPTYYAPSCRLVEREPVWDGYGWRQRRPIRVCD
jgi:hypothetical protein